MDLYVVKTDGSGLTNLTNGQIWSFYFTTLAWSPDSKEIVFAPRNNMGYIEIQCVNIMTKNVRVLLSNLGLNDPHPTWSPSGTLIVFMYDQYIAHTQTRDLYLINSDGTNLHKLTPSKPNKNHGDYYPNWSPNGQRIVFTNGYTGDLYIVQADGSNLQKYISRSCKRGNSRGYLNPRWSPDSQYIAVLCQKGKTSSLEIIDSLNLEQPAINFGPANDFAFSADGRYIWFYNPLTGGFIADTDGKNQAAFMNGIEKLAWVPNSIETQTIEPMEQAQNNQQPSTSEYCNNPYWPIIQGVWWKYYLPGDTSTAPDHNWIDTIDSISQNGDTTTFNISSAEVGSTYAQPRTYSCDKSGWIFDGNGNAILPPESLLTEGYQWTLSDGTVMAVHFIHLLESRTTLGILDLLQITRVGQMYWDLYSYGVGPYGFGTGASSADLTEYYLPESTEPLNAEAQIRYILADAMLNGIDYYRSHNDQPAVAEAIRRWDACVRVSNIDQFERKVIVNQGWLVTYKGTEQPIDGMDVTLTAEGCSTTTSLCSNSYFPVVEGAKWTYFQTTSTGEQIETGPATYTVENVKENEYGGLDFIWMLSYGGVDYNQIELSCDGGVIHRGDVIWTPNSSDMVEGKQVPYGNTYRTIFPLTSINTRMGQFNAVPICENGVDPLTSNSCYYFVENIGIVQITEKGIPKLDIMSYSINKSVPPNVKPGDLCGNPYWPIVNGAQYTYQWTFTYESGLVDSYPETFTITDVAGSFQSATFSWIGSAYSCNSEIISSPASGHLLPVEDILLTKTSYQEYSLGFEKITVPAGTFDTVVTCAYNACTYYAKGVGEALYVTSGEDPRGKYSFKMELIDYQFP